MIHIKKLHKAFGELEVLKGIDLEIKAGEVVCIIGPSGSGKSTVLRCINRLETPTSGTVIVDGHDIMDPATDINTVRTEAGMVFQQFNLFPHMTVLDNVTLGPIKVRKVNPEEARHLGYDLLAKVGLAAKAENYPDQLSGGQKQRVAIARAMVVEPDLLLLDEPFANLDRNLKLETALFIRSTQRNFGITTICVTHDLQEALAMSDRIGVMLGGRLRQYAPPLEVYRHPVDMDTARFLGPVNTITPDLARMLGITACWLRPEALRLRPDPDGPGAVTAMHFAGHFLAYTVRVLDQDLTVYTLEPVAQPGERVSLSISDQYPPIFTHTAEASCSIE